jgi:hypothetical protein
MQTRLIGMLLMFLFAFSASVSAKERHMQRLNSLDGWVIERKALYWTSNGGENWSDITPKIAGSEVETAFFLNSQVGWVLLNSPEDEENQLQLAYTTSAGQNWTTQALALPNPLTSWVKRGAGFSGSGHLFFLDSLHGWLDLDVSANTNFLEGVLLATSDGGRTWTWDSHNPGKPGSVVFVGLKDGWEVSADGYHLYGTNDGGKTWTEANLAANHCPNKAANGHSTIPDYSLPIFQDHLHGFETLVFRSGGSRNHRLCAALFSTDDGGSSWKVLKTLPDIKTDSPTITSTVVDKTWITAAEASEHEIVLNKLKTDGSGGQGNVNTNVFDPEFAFVSPTVGWIRTPKGIFSTQDGGTTWTLSSPKSQTPSSSASSPSAKIVSAPASAHQVFQSGQPVGGDPHIGVARYSNAPIGWLRSDAPNPKDFSSDANFDYLASRWRVLCGDFEEFGREGISAKAAAFQQTDSSS